MYNATPKAAIYNCIISDNSSDISLTGTAQGNDTQVSKQTSIIGASLLDADGSTLGGWSFNAGSMLGALDFYNGGLTRSFSLIDSDTNPAADQGMSSAALQAVATEHGAEPEYAATDQNGKERTRNSIGSYAL